MDGSRPKAANAQARLPEQLEERLAGIEEQGRQTLELVRALVALFMPKEGVREGPSLEELLSTVIAQQRETIIIVKATQENLARIGEALPLAVVEALEEHTNHPRTASS